jgi:hypothetical protein
MWGCASRQSGGASRGRVSGMNAQSTARAADRQADHAHRQVEAAGIAGEVGHHQRQHHAEHCPADAVERLDRHHQAGRRGDGEQQAAQGHGGKAQQQHRAAAPALGGMPHQRG